MPAKEGVTAVEEKDLLSESVGKSWAPDAVGLLKIRRKRLRIEHD